MKKSWRFIRGILIVVVTVIFTTVVINATDNFGNLSDSLLGSVIGAGEKSPCLEGMVYVPTGDGGFCIDRFENSPNGHCAFADPKNQDETERNLENTACFGASVEGVVPWRNIARHQAELACRNAGKRLPTNKEWYQASLGTPDARGNVERNDCNVKTSTISETGAHPLCISSSGAYDMIGNAWEWVEETISEGALEGQELPDEGYVTSIDSRGVPIETNFNKPDLNFNEDYLWVEKEGVRGMIRGGYYGSGTDAGQYTVNAITPTSFAGTGVGFRCVK